MWLFHFVKKKKPLKTSLNSKALRKSRPHSNRTLHVLEANVTSTQFAHCEPGKQATHFTTELLVTRKVTVVAQFHLGSNSCSCLRTIRRVLSKHIAFCLFRCTAAVADSTLKMCEISHLRERESHLI